MARRSNANCALQVSPRRQSRQHCQPGTPIRHRHRGLLVCCAAQVHVIPFSTFCSHCLRFTPPRLSSAYSSHCFFRPKKATYELIHLALPLLHRARNCLPLKLIQEASLSMGIPLAGSSQFFRRESRPPTCLTSRRFYLDGGPCGWACLTQKQRSSIGDNLVFNLNCSGLRTPTRT